MNTTPFFETSPSLNVQVKIFYKEQQVFGDFFGRNPLLRGLYKSDEEINARFFSLKNKTEKGKLSILEIRENYIKEFPNIKSN